MTDRWTPSVVVVAASTGGPTALARLLEPLQAALPVPVVVVQHMPEGFTSTFARRLDGSCKVSVREAAPREVVGPGQVLVAAGGHHLRFASPNVVVWDDSDPRHGCRPAADVLFGSAVQVYGGRVLAVVLTGMGRDGCAGAQAVVDAGGRVLAQDKESSAVWGMPGAVVNAGLAHQVAAPERLAAAVAAAAR